MQNLMSGKRGFVAWLAAGLGLVLIFALPAAAQGVQPKPADPQQQPPPGQSQQQPNAENPAAQAPPVNKAEEDAYKTFYGLQLQQTQLIISQGEDFLAKYPTSRYRSSVYSRVVAAYLNSGDSGKMIATGEKAIAENPDNVDVLALVSTVIPRTVDPRSLDADQKLSEAERYARRAIELVSAMQKAEGVTEEQFTTAKNEKLGMAHFGLGLVYYMRGNSAGSVPELEQSAKLDPTPEPLLFYLLGTGEMKQKKFPEAAAAFDRCAKAQWDAQWQARCKKGAEEAKQAAAAPAKP